MKPSEGNLVRERYGHLIAGEWVKPNGGAYFDGINPSTGEKLGSFARGDVVDIDRAVRAAEIGFAKWWDLDPHKRGQIMNKVAQLLRQHKERIAYLESLDMGKPLTVTAGDVETSQYRPVAPCDRSASPITWIWACQEPQAGCGDRRSKLADPPR